jgi:PAS domain S-box-containing protein
VTALTEGAGGLDRFDSALLETLVLEAPVAFAFYDVGLRYRRINQSLAEINGLPIEAHLGRRPRDILPAPLAAAIEQMLVRVLNTGEAIADDDFTASAPTTGEVRCWQSRWFPGRSADGQIHGVAVLVTDVTDRRRAEAALRESHQRTQRLQQATAELAQALTIDEVVKVIARIGAATLGATWSGVALLDQERLRFEMFGEPASGLTAVLPHLPLDSPYPSSVAARTGQPVYLSSRAQLRARHPAPDLDLVLAHIDEQAWAALPLLAGNATIGVLRVAFDEERELTPEERVFLEALAGQCALAVERSRAYERERGIAAALKRSLVPDRLPELAGLDLAGLSLPGAEDAGVGGDWYDAFTLADGRLGVVVGDVVGSGVVAAASMGRVRAALRALAFTDPSPASVLTGLDALFTATEEPEQLVTLVYAVVERDLSSIVVGVAGHLPLLLIPGDGPVRPLEPDQATTPLGVAETRVERRLVLTPGDTLVAYSDGLVESRCRDLDQGIALLVATAAGLRRRPLRELLDGLVAASLADQGRHDDVTVLGLRTLT